MSDCLLHSRMIYLFNTINGFCKSGHSSDGSLILRRHSLYAAFLRATTHLRLLIESRLETYFCGWTAEHAQWNCPSGNQWLIGDRRQYFQTTPKHYALFLVGLTSLLPRKPPRASTRVTRALNECLRSIIALIESWASRLITSLQSFARIWFTCLLSLRLSS